MASPTVVGTPTESNATTDDATPYTVSRPAGVSGQLTIALIAVDGQPTLTWPSGYTQFFTQSRAGTFTIYGAYHQENGTEGTTFDIVSSASEKWAAIVYSISGAANPSAQVPEGTTVDGSAATANPDPPSITPTGGSKDYLFIAAVSTDGEEADDDTWGNSSPTNYTPSVPRQKTTATTGLAATNTSLETAERALTASSENPGTFNNDQTLVYVAATVAVHPPPPAVAVRVTGSEAVLVYRVPARVTASEIVFAYNVPARVTASEILLAYSAPGRVTASEVVLDYEPPGGTPVRVTGSEFILDYISTAQITAVEALLDYIATAQIAASEAVLAYNVPARVVSSEAVLDYAVFDITDYGSVFLYDESNWEGKEFYFEVFMQAIVGAIHARLFDMTANAPVAGTELSTESTDFIRLRTPAIKTLLIDGHEYRAQFGKIGADTGEFFSARLIAFGGA